MPPVPHVPGAWSPCFSPSLLLPSSPIFSSSSPTKAWLVGVRDTEQWRAHFNKVYGKRPEVELYDLRTDPDEMHSLADDPAYRDVRNQLKNRLFAELERTDDPRLIDDGRFYETPPMAGPLKH